MKLDSSTAWKDTMAALGGNSEVIAAIAGVFFLLPSLAMSLFIPEPEAVPGMTPEQAMTMLQDFYLKVLPWFIPVTLLQTVGTLAVITLCTDRSRPTVGEALKQGVAGFLPYFASSLVFGLGFGLAGGVLLGIAAVTGSPVVIAMVVIVMLAAVAYCAFRLSLTAPVVAIERVRNPIAVLVRSWALTQGNAGRIALLLFLVTMVFVVVMIAVSAVAGIISALALGAGAAKVVNAVVSSLMGAGLTTLFAALLAAIHRQLSGDAQAVTATFE